MKKFLTMALALMMVLSLFAVPAMAEATTVYQELIYDGGFEATNTKIGSANTAYGFIVDSAAIAYADSAIKKDGNYSMRIETTDPTTDNIAEFRSNIFAITAGAELKLSADVYLTTEYADTADGTGAVQFTVRDTTANNVGWGTGRATAEGFEKDYVAPTGAGFMFDGLPLNTWVHVECTSTPTVTKTGSYLYVRPQSSRAYVDNLSAEKAVTGYGINVTELNDFGTVSASEAVAADGTTDILVIPEKGYYPYEITLNGTNVTAAAVKKYAAANYAIPYWSYTLDGSTLTADAEITVTYGYYTYEELAPGGDAEGLTTWNETGLGKAGNSVVTLDTTIAKGTQSFKVTSVAAKNTYNLRTPTIALEPGETYVTEFDAYTDSTAFTDIAVGGLVKVNNVYIVAMNGYLQANINMKQNSYLPIKTGEWMHFAVYFDNTSATETTERTIDYKMTCANDTDSVYFDNITFKKITKAGAAPVAPVEPPAPTTAAVTISGANAVTSVDNATVAIGETTRFTAKPAFGYYIDSITIGGVEFAGFDAYTGGTYTTGAIAADTAIVVTTASLADNTDANVSTEVATLPAVFAESTTAVTFGKVLDTTNAESWGVELTKGGVGVTPYHGGSYLYQANATSANGQYAIEFIGLEAGTYQIRSYVYVNGTPEFGAPATFVVAE